MINCGAFAAAPTDDLLTLAPTGHCESAHSAARQARSSSKPLPAPYSKMPNRPGPPLHIDHRVGRPAGGTRRLHLGYVAETLHNFVEVYGLGKG